MPELTEPKRQTIAKLLSSAIINKENPHPADLARAAVILYDINRLGYNLVDATLFEILDDSDDNYSQTMREWLGRMANAYSDLVTGMNDAQYSKYRVNEVDLGDE